MPGSEGAEQAKRRCASCGAEVESNNAFCTSCGARIDGARQVRDPSVGITKRPGLEDGRSGSSQISRRAYEEAKAKWQERGEGQVAASKAAPALGGRHRSGGPMVSAYSAQECVDRAEAFMVGGGFSVHRGGTTATFARDRPANWLVFGVLLLFGVLPGVLYMVMIAAKPLRTTLVAMPTEAGTRLTVKSDDEGDAAMLEGWIRSNLLAGGSR